MTNDELLSKTISYLRFPLTVGVVFIHNRMTTVNIQGEEMNYGDLWPWLSYIITFFSYVVSAVSVPLFFFISGFLFFYKVDFCKDVYRKKLKSRRDTLLVPYLIWNFMAFLILLTQMHPRFSSLFPLLSDYRIDITEFLSYFWAKYLPMDPVGEVETPLNPSLWFVRDLMLLAIASPLVYWVIKRLKSPAILLLCIVWFFDLGKQVGLYGMSQQSIFFFPLGAYFSINRINFIEFVRNAQWAPCIYAVLAVADTISDGQPYNYWFHNTGILTGLIAVTYIVSTLLRQDKVRISQFLSGSSFFVFAAHELFIGKFMKALVMIIQPQSPYVVLLLYFLIPIATILVCLGAYWLLSRWAPGMAKVLTGGR